MPRIEYPANLVEFARRLHEDKGWSAHRIAKAIEARGRFSPASTTVLSWIDPDYAAARRERTRVEMRSRHGGSYRGPGRRRLYPWDRRRERMRELRAVGLSYRSVAAVMSLDHEDIVLTEHQVRAIFRGETGEATVRKLLWPQGAQ